MVVLHSHGASYQPMSVATTNTTTANSMSLNASVKAMDPVRKSKSPLLEKGSVEVKLQMLVKTPNLQTMSNGSPTRTENSQNRNSPIAAKPENGLTKTTCQLPGNESSVAIVAVPKRKKGRPPKSAVTLKASAKVKNAASKSPKARQSKVLLDSVIPFITCNLCKGYLVDATTIVECLHTFCHSCIMIHLRQKQYCPCCELMINKSKPNIKPDAIRQAIVYKLVPGLYEKEILRRQEFYRAHPDEAKLATPEQRGEDTENLIFSPNENISLSIEYADTEDTDDLDGVWKSPKYLQCPANFTVSLLSKFIMRKVGMDANKFLVDISYKVKTIVLADYYTLMDVAYIYTWKREAPMRFYFSVRTKETTHEELPEVPFRRSPGIVPNAVAAALPPPLLVADTGNPGDRREVIADVDVASDKSAANSSSVPPPVVQSVETKLKLVKKVDDSQRVSDKKRVVYMVQSAQSDNGPQISAAAAYAMLPHETISVGVNSTPTLASQSSNGAGGASHIKPMTAKQQQQQQQRKVEEATPRYRSLVEKENAKMKKLMQSLSEEKKLLKMRKREAMKEAAAAAAANASTATATEKKLDTLKLKITKNDSGLMVIQSSSDREEKKDVLSVIDSVANCDTNDDYKKSLFLNSFDLKPKTTIPVQKTVKSSIKSPKRGDKTPTELKKSISFGFSSYEFEKSDEDDKDTPQNTPKAESVKQKTPLNPTLEKPKKTSTPLKRSASEEKLGAIAGQSTPRKKFSSYVKIAPKELTPIQPKPAANSSAEKSVTAKPTPQPSNKNIKVATSTVTLPVMAPPPIPQQQQPRAPANGSIYAFLHSNPSAKQLFKPMGAGHIPSMAGYSQFQTMPSPVYMTNANAGSTPIYSPNSPQYSPNFGLPQHQQFKYTKFPTYMTSFSMPTIPAPTSSTSSAPAATSVTGMNSGKVPEPVAAKPKRDEKVLTSTANINKGVSYLNKLPPPPIFSPSSGMSITTTTTVAPPPVPPLAVLPKRSPETESNSGKRKNTSSPAAGLDAVAMAAPNKPQSPAVREDPPEKQRKVQSLLDSCNITFPSSLSITIANENEDGDKSGLHNNKLKNPVNNYIEILKIPSSDPANCSPEQNNKFPVSAASVLQKQQQQQQPQYSKPPTNAQQLPPPSTGKQNNPSTFAAATAASSQSNVMKPPTPPITTAPVMKLGSGSMSITPAITSNMMHLINAKSPLDSMSMIQAPPPISSVSDLKRKSPPIEVTAVKRPLTSSMKPPKSNVQAMPPPLKQVTSTGESNKNSKTVPKLMPKLNPIEKVSNAKQVPQKNVVPLKPAPPTTTANNIGGAAAVAAAAIATAKETFQREFLKFANDKVEGEDANGKAGNKPAAITAAKVPTGGLKGHSEKDRQKPQAKSPVKIKPKSSGAQQEKKHSVANNKPQLSETRMNPTAIAPFPLHNHLQQQQQHQQQQQSQEYAAAALMKMLEFQQQQQKLAALQQSQYPTVLGDLMMSNPVAMFNSPVVPQQQQQQQQQQQLSTLLQQACLMEHFERMKRAGKEALERYAQNIQQEQKLVAQKEASKSISPKPPNGQSMKPKPEKKTPSPVPSKIATSSGDLKESAPKLEGGNKTTSGGDSKLSPKPLQMNNHQANVKQEDKKDTKA